jgi:hypothetical protein
MDLRETVCEDERWIELAEDRVQWWALLIGELNLPVVSPRKPEEPAVITFRQ